MQEDTKPPNQKFFFPVGLHCVLRGCLLLETGRHKYLLNWGLEAAEAAPQSMLSPKYSVLPLGRSLLVFFMASPLCSSTSSAACEWQNEPAEIPFTPAPQCCAGCRGSALGCLSRRTVSAVCRWMLTGSRETAKIPVHDKRCAMTPGA